MRVYHQSAVGLSATAHGDWTADSFTLSLKPGESSGTTPIGHGDVDGCACPVDLDIPLVEPPAPVDPCTVHLTGDANDGPVSLRRTSTRVSLDNPVGVVKVPKEVMDGHEGYFTSRSWSFSSDTLR